MNKEKYIHPETVIIIDGVANDTICASSLGGCTIEDFVIVDNGWE